MILLGLEYASDGPDPAVRRAGKLSFERAAVVTSPDRGVLELARRTIILRRGDRKCLRLGCCQFAPRTINQNFKVVQASVIAGRGTVLRL